MDCNCIVFGIRPNVSWPTFTDKQTDTLGQTS